MSDSEVNRLKTGAFTFRLETLPHLVLSVSPHVSHLVYLTLLVSHLSSRDKLNLICDVEVCAGLFEVLFRTHPLPRYILFVHISAERKRARLTNKFSLHKIVFILFVLSRVLNLLTEKCQ